MKKLIFCLLAAGLSVTFAPKELKAASDSVRTQTTAQAAEAQILMNRLEEIRSIDRSTLSSSEKKALRKEVRAIDKELREFSGGIYISVGALILILILLILFT